MEAVNRQHDHYSATNNRRCFPITLVCDNLNSPANAGTLFRLCEAFGVSQIVFIGSAPDLKSSRLKRTARSTIKNVPVAQFQDTATFLESEYEPDAVRIALELTSRSIPLHQLKIELNAPLQLIIGNERHGISKPLLEKATYTVYINMYGQNSSMNVASATAIALYCLTQKLLGQP